ncbi:DUF1269 domain-containing protein [Nocardioides sp. BP30]|uniref:DUF1269 domain-containing protein n=1 Tax=Nocardioides sp. BP30 TaxID=3036374 RepID=UPI0024684C2F|nr:DUF1269 domain-containing protein [Nocardioides sp. BP30]WGL50389.1 DUF1269 domain-containing protein [Nocardioides sp. BP30]
MSGSTTLTVWVYDSALGAAAGEVRLKDLEQRNALVVHDAVTVTWFPGAHEPRIGHVRHRALLSAGQGSMLGVILGAALFVPVAGVAVGAGAGVLMSRLHGVGIERSLLEDLRARLAPGRSALVVLSSEADPETVRTFVSRGLARGDVELLYARLSDDAPAELRALVEEAVARDDSGSP